MASGNTGKLKLLVVTSRDFGEVTGAVYFASDPNFDSCLLIRPTLAAVHGKDLPVPFQVYESIPEIVAAVDRLRPDIVGLFSGYLFAHDEIFSGDKLKQLIEVLQQRGCRVLTTDPFLGWLENLDELMPFATAEERELNRTFGPMQAMLRSLPHLYDVDPGGFVSNAKVFYSNPNVVQPPGQSPCSPEVRKAVGLDPARPRWVFVLAGEDYGRLLRTTKRPFHDLLTDQLYEAIAQGRQPVLVAPQACVSEVGFRTNAADGVVLLPFCRHSWFVSLVLEAEYVFYWNMSSNSLQLRVVNRLPFFLFDLGHMANTSPRLRERMAQCYYVAGVPDCLDFSQPLDGRQLARSAARHEPAVRAMAENFLRAPLPAAALRQFFQRTV